MFCIFFFSRDRKKERAKDFVYKELFDMISNIEYAKFNSKREDFAQEVSWSKVQILELGK